MEDSTIMEMLGSGLNSTAGGSHELCASGQYNLSCLDDTLSSSGVNPVRWKTSTPGTANATATILLLYMILGIPCNVFIIMTILYKKLYQEPLHIVLLNLVINDIILCLTSLPMNVISGFAGEFVFGRTDVERCHVCQLGILLNLFLVLNIHLLMLMSIDRFIFFQFPFHYPRLVTVKTTLAATTLIWVFCILLSLPPLFQFGEVRFTHSISTCMVYFLDRTSVTYNIFYETFILVEAFVFPVPILVVMNIGVLRLVCKHINKIYSFRGSSDRSASNYQEEGNTAGGRRTILKRNTIKNKKQFKLVRVYGAIVIFHVISWLPVICNTILIFTFCEKPFVIPHGIFVFNYVSLMLGVVMHPVLQACLIPEIRDVLLKCSCKTQHKATYHLDQAQQNGSRKSLLKSISTVLSFDSNEAGRHSKWCLKKRTKTTGTDRSATVAPPPSLTINDNNDLDCHSSCPSPVSHRGTSPLLGLRSGQQPHAPSPLDRSIAMTSNLSPSDFPTDRATVQVEAEDPM